MTWHSLNSISDMPNILMRLSPATSIRAPSEAQDIVQGICVPSTKDTTASDVLRNRCCYIDPYVSLIGLLHCEPKHVVRDL